MSTMVEPAQKRVKRSLTTLASPHAAVQPPVPEVLLLAICHWLVAQNCKGGFSSSPTVAASKWHRFRAFEAVRHFLPLSCVNRFWRRIALGAAWGHFPQEFRDAACSISPTLTPIYAAAKMERWGENLCTDLEPAIVAGLVGPTWVSRFGFKRVSKIVRWKREPEKVDNEEDWMDALEAYAEDDGPMINKRHEFDGGFGKVTHNVFVQLVRRQQMLEVKGEMFFEVDSGNVSSFHELEITLGTSGRRLHGKQAARATVLTWQRHDDEEEEESSLDSSVPVANFFDRDSMEEAMADLVTILQSIFHRVPGPCSYADDWSGELKLAIGKAVRSTLGSMPGSQQSASTLDPSDDDSVSGFSEEDDE